MQDVAVSELESKLQEEYKILLARWDDFDRRALTMKGWVAAGMLVAIPGFEKADTWIAPLFAMIVALSMWVLESIWKSWQHTFANRINAIEDYFHGNGLTVVPFQAHRCWAEIYASEKDRQLLDVNVTLALREGRRGFVALPYAPFMFICLILVFRYA